MANGQLTPCFGPHLQWLSKPANRALFDASRHFDILGSDELLFPDMQGMALPDLRTLKAKACQLDEFLREDARDGGLAARWWPVVLRQACPTIPAQEQDLKGMLLCLLARCLRNRRTRSAAGLPLHQFLEGFAGRAMISLHLLMHGFQGKRFDVEYDGAQDFLSNFGLWLQEWIISSEEALHWSAPKCSSFVILCRGPSGRKEENRFWGDEAKAWVKQGNMIMVRTALLVLLSDLAGCRYVVEQPCNSVMFKAPPMSTVLRLTGANRIVTWHNAFGAESPKPFTLLSSIPADILAKGLKRRKRSFKGIKLVNKKGTKFSGNRNLTKSQAYTPAFGWAVAAMWQECCRKRHDQA